MQPVLIDLLEIRDFSPDITSVKKGAIWNNRLNSVFFIISRQAA